jgi:hypothetical protein
MSVISVMYEWEHNGELLPLYWCMFIYLAYIFFCMCDTQIDIEVDRELDEPNTFEDDLQDTFEQGKWILPLYILFVPN